MGNASHDSILLDAREELRRKTRLELSDSLSQSFPLACACGDEVVIVTTGQVKAVPSFLCTSGSRPPQFCRMKDCPVLLSLFDYDVLGVIAIWKYLVQTSMAVVKISCRNWL